MKKLYLVLLVLLFFLFKCASTEDYVKPGTNFNKYNRIAVLPFSDFPQYPGSGIQVADIVTMEFIKHGINVIDRSNINHILKEQSIGLSGVIDKSTAPKVGKLLGVKGIMTGSIYNYSTTVTNIQVIQGGNPAYMPISKVGITLKFIDTETGEIVWSASAEGSEIGRNVQAAAAKKAINKSIEQFIKHL